MIPPEFGYAMYCLETPNPKCFDEWNKSLIEYSHYMGKAKELTKLMSNFRHFAGIIWDYDIETKKLDIFSKENQKHIDITYNGDTLVYITNVSIPSRELSEEHEEFADKSMTLNILSKVNEFILMPPKDKISVMEKNNPNR
ncbi:MAG: hypothetical protein CI952_8 [Methanohalophilus sp.]|jgi:hypothetical protein|nr:MAG: hypothetical protein CI952_8 [Methanohalophilus sp.]